MDFFNNNYNLSTLSDEDLISIINIKDKNSHNAFSIITERYIRDIRIKAVAYRGAKTEFDDFVQEGLIALLNAVKSYNPKKNASFSTYANICIERRFYSVYKSENKLKAIPKDKLISLNEDILDNVSNNNNPLQSIIEQEELQTLLTYISSTLSDFEYKVFLNYINSYSYSDIAEKLSTTPKSVGNAMQRIRSKLKNVKTK